MPRHYYLVLKRLSQRIARRRLQLVVVSFLDDVNDIKLQTHIGCTIVFDTQTIIQAMY